MESLARREGTSSFGVPVAPQGQRVPAADSWPQACMHPSPAAAGGLCPLSVQDSCGMGLGECCVGHTPEQNEQHTLSLEEGRTAPRTVRPRAGCEGSTSW